MIIFSISRICRTKKLCVEHTDVKVLINFDINNYLDYLDNVASVY